VKLVSLFILSLLIGCGAESNLNSFFVTEVEEQSFESLMEAAQAEYDLGNYEKAVELSLEAEKKNPDDPEAIILGAFAALGNANLDPIVIGKKLLELEAEQEKTGVEKNTDDFLGDLQDILGITDADLAKMGTRKTATFDGVEYIYYEPKSSEDARSSLATLSNIKQVLDKMCIYVPSTSKVSTDPRHQCTVQNSSLERQTSIQFLWALAHLGETLYFNSILLYAPEGQETPSLQAYADAIANREYVATDAEVDLTENAGTLDEFVSAITTLAGLVDAVFNSNSGTPMIESLLNNLDTAQLSISDIESVPDAFREAISKSSEKINGIRDVLQQSGSEEELSISAARADLLKSSGDKLLDKLAESDVKENLTPDQLDAACEEIKKLLGLDPNSPIPAEISNNADECN